MTTRLAVTHRIVIGALAMIALGIVSSLIDPRPHRAPLTYYVRSVDLAVLVAWGLYVYRTPCARCGKPVRWRGFHYGDFNCPYCGADSGSEFPSS